MQLSVIIPCYNAADTIGDQLQALSEQKWEQPWEVIVADNRSTDHSMQVVRKYFNKIENLKIIDAFEIKGVSYARNLGVQKANGEYIAFCDADDIVGENWLPVIGNALMKHDFVASRMDWGRLNNFSEYVLNAKVQTNGLIDFSMVDYLQHGGGGTLGIKREIHNEIGGFDEKLDRLQDVEYCWRVQLKGYQLKFVPEAVIHIRAQNTDYKIFGQELKWAEYDVYLYEKYKDYGMPEFTIKQNIRSLYHVLLRIKNLFHSEKRTLWLIRLSLQVGRLKGMIKYRFLKMNL